MPTGSIKWFDDTRGVGFITCDDGSSDVFLHFPNIMVTGHKTVDAGQRVAFQIFQGPKGPQAELVRILEPHEDATLSKGA